MTATARRAGVVLPAASFAEATGTLVNMEGRAQRYFQNFDPAYYDRHVATLESWRWLGRIEGGSKEAENLDDVLADFEAALPQFKGVAAAAPGATFRMHGMGLARAPHRQSGRTAARAIVFVHEPRSTTDVDTALNFSMEGYNGAGKPKIVRRNCCRLRGRPAGTRRRRGTSSRPKSAVHCAAAIPASISFARRRRPFTDTSPPQRRRPHRGAVHSSAWHCTNTSAPKS